MVRVGSNTGQQAERNPPCALQMASVRFRGLGGEGYSTKTCSMLLVDRYLQILRGSFSILNWINELIYNRIISTKSPPFSVTTVNPCVTNLVAHQYQLLHNRRILALPPLRLQEHTDLLAFSRLVWHQRRHTLPATDAWDCGITPNIARVGSVIGFLRKHHWI